MRNCPSLNLSSLPRKNPIPLYASAGVSVVKYLQSLLNCGTMENDENEIETTEKTAKER